MYCQSADYTQTFDEELECKRRTTINTGLQITVEITLDLDYYTELHAIDRQSGRNASLTIENAWAAKPLAEMEILKDGGEVALWKEVEPHDEL